MPEDQRERVALFRYSVISEAVSDRLSHAERGLVVRALASLKGPDTRCPEFWGTGLL